LGDAENTKKLKSQFATLVKDKIKLESKNLRKSSAEARVLSEARWAKLAGIKDED
jgi:hypothetical protein